MARSVCLEPQLTSVRQRAVKPALILSRSLRNFIPIPFCCDALRRFRLTLRQAQTYTHTHSGICTHIHTGERTLQHTHNHTQHTHTYLKSVPQWKLSFGSVLRYHFHFFLCRHSHTHMLTRSLIHTLTHSLTYTCALSPSLSLSLAQLALSSVQVWFFAQVFCFGLHFGCAMCCKRVSPSHTHTHLHTHSLA